jgi:hypothetical protein
MVRLTQRQQAAMRSLGPSKIERNEQVTVTRVCFREVKACQFLRQKLRLLIQAIVVILLSDEALPRYPQSSHYSTIIFSNSTAPQRLVWIPCHQQSTTNHAAPTAAFCISFALILLWLPSIPIIVASPYAPAAIAKIARRPDM